MESDDFFVNHQQQFFIWRKKIKDMGKIEVIEKMHFSYIINWFKDCKLMLAYWFKGM